MCVWGTSDFVTKENGQIIYVDACLAIYVQCMIDLGIVTVACCCGHGKSPSNILVSISSTEMMNREGYRHYPYRVKGDDFIIHYPIVEEEEQS